MADYDSLVADIKAWTENTSSELTDNIPRFIQLGEARCARELPLRFSEATATGSLAIGDPMVPIPGDLMATIHFAVDCSDGHVCVLGQRTPEYLRVYWPEAGEVGTPKYFAVEGTSFRLAPTPFEVAPYHLRYRARPPALTSGNKTNWLTEHVYEALLYACLAEAAVFVLDDRQGGLIELYERKWAEKAAAAVSTEALTRRDQERLPNVMAANV